MILVMVLYALFASVFTIEKTCLLYSPPLFLVGSRMFLAGTIMLSYRYMFNRQEFQFQWKSIWKILLLAIFNIYLTNNLSPFLAALLSYFIFAEKLSWKKWIGLGVGFVGFIPILISKSAGEEATGNLFFFSWSEEVMFLAVICSVYGWILLRQLICEDGCSFYMANGFSMLLGGAMALVNSYLVEDWDPTPVTNTVGFIECSILLLIISNLICYNLYGALLKRYTATFLSFAGFTTPLFTAFFGWLYLGEIVTWHFYLSALIVFLGLLIFYQEEELKGIYETLPEKI
jgi:drug/metabolite transporter (DMT)-like permease